MSTDASLPNDLEACQRELVAARQAFAQLQQEAAHTESVLAETAVACEEQRASIEKLTAELELFKRYLFGRKSERFVEDPAQGRLFEPPADGSAPTPELSEAAEEEITYKRRRKGHGWSELPAHLPREEILLDVPEKDRLCDCCGEGLVKIGARPRRAGRLSPGSCRGEGLCDAQVCLPAEGRRCEAERNAAWPGARRPL